MSASKLGIVPVPADVPVDTTTFFTTRPSSAFPTGDSSVDVFNADVREVRLPRFSLLEITVTAPPKEEDDTGDVNVPAGGDSADT